MQTTLIDGLVNFKEGFSTKLTAVRRSARWGAGVRGGGRDGAVGDGVGMKGAATEMWRFRFRRVSDIR
ncbi:hypothetical protein WI82_06385 [Burkholderia ubonensis]|nr:hypothetical protein WI82_06385 [Burkholderia ubonensis]KVZ47698.1 hypothetical protein WL17_28765 [Burkholderia ubonensis]